MSKTILQVYSSDSVNLTKKMSAALNLQMLATLTHFFTVLQKIRLLNLNRMKKSSMEFLVLKVSKYRSHQSILELLRMT